MPLFALALVMAFRRSKPVFLLYAAPALVMLGLHAAIANHYTRYNLILIGPFSIGAAWMISRLVLNFAERRRLRIKPARPPRRMPPINES